VIKPTTAAGLERRPLASSLSARPPIEACRAFLNIEPSKRFACIDSAAERKVSISIGVCERKEAAKVRRAPLERISADGYQVFAAA
jgi:hypothetical protein